MKDRKSIPTPQPNQRNDEFGHMVPGIQTAVPTDVEKSHLVPSIQPIAKPDVGPQPVADTQPVDNPQTVTVVQPEATPQAEPSAEDSSE